MCYFSDEEFRRQNRGIFTAEEISRIAKLFFPKSLQLVIGCGTEPTLYKNFPDIVSLAKSYRIPLVSLTSNGQLLTEAHLRSLISMKLDEITLSVHGVQKTMYEKFMVQASYEKLHEVLALLDALKHESRTEYPQLRLNYTVNSENLEELAGFYESFGKYKIATLQVRPIMDIGGQYRTLLESGKIERYNFIIERLSIESRKRGITFLANTADPTYERENYHGVILPAVKRYISPQVVWQPEFDWRAETYDDYCWRVHWDKYLMQCALSTKKNVLHSNAEKYSARYEVLV